MDNDNYNQGGSNPDNLTLNPLQQPTIRPIQPVGAQLRRPSEPSTLDQVPIEPSEPSPHKKSTKSSALVGILCGILGLAIGAAGVYGIMQLLKEPTPDCPDCTCPKCPTSTGSLNGLTTSFLTLEPQGQNIIYSPLSIRYGLSLLDAGAAGTTKTQIDSLLSSEELPKYENVADILSLANAVFIRDTYKEIVLSSYLNTVQNDYNSEVIYDNFSSSVDMDSWVSQKTFGLINQIGIQPNDLTKMVLANALAIQMDWVSKFEDDSTYGKTFYKQDGEEINATTMSQLTHNSDIKYYTDDSTTLLSMPLQKTSTDVNLDFIAVMPTSDLEDYISNLDINAVEKTLDSATSASTPQDGVIIHIPKFKYEYELGLKQDLQSLGITQAFTNAADFSAMASEPLEVSDAIHKANIDFSEDGIKAAAITVFTMENSSEADENQRVPEPIIINIDHPFLFLIRDRDNGAIWFIGTVYEPNLWENDQADYQESYGYDF